MKPQADKILVGELARRSGVNLETVRYYERRGLLPKPPRTPAGYRAFPAASVRRVRFIRQAQALGFTLAEIKELLALRVDPDTTCCGRAGACGGEGVGDRAEDRVPAGDEDGPVEARRVVSRRPGSGE